MEEQVAAWFAARAAADPAAELARREALEGTWPDPATREAVARKFLRLFGTSARPLAARGWQVRTSRIVWRSPDGNWARLMVWRQGWQGSLVVLVVWHLYSARLLRVLDGRAADPEPPAPKVMPHLIPLLIEVAFTTGEAPPDAPAMALPHTDSGIGPHILLGPATAKPWLDDLLSRVADASMTWTADDRSLRDALASMANPSDWTALRRAAVLTWLIGDHDRLPDLVARAGVVYDQVHAWRRATESEVAGSVTDWGDQSRMDRTRDIESWSHPRFMRFIERDLPRKVQAQR